MIESMTETMPYMDIYARMDPPYDSFDAAILEGDFPKELETVSCMWFACGYRPGITAYLNFFLLKDFIVTHDSAYPPRFQSFKSMANSFYQTDLFIREVSDTGLKPTGGISSQKVRGLLRQIMARHRHLSIPTWMMTYFGFSLMENVEKQCGEPSEDEKQWHLQYMAKTYRLMGMPFSEDRRAMEQFARGVEAAHAGPSPSLEKHARNILTLGEMLGVASDYDGLASFLPEPTRAVFGSIYEQIRLRGIRRAGARLFGRLFMKQAIGAPRKAVPARS